MKANPSAVIASEAKQSIGTENSATMDCFVASLLAMTDETYALAEAPPPQPSPARAGEGAQRVLVTLSRLRGRVARASARDGWGLAPQISLPDGSAVRPRPE
jgi:hypothetical protein